MISSCITDWTSALEKIDTVFYYFRKQKKSEWESFSYISSRQKSWDMQDLQSVVQVQTNSGDRKLDRHDYSIIVIFFNNIPKKRKECTYSMLLLCHQDKKKIKLFFQGITWWHQSIFIWSGR